MGSQPIFPGGRRALPHYVAAQVAACISSCGVMKTRPCHTSPLGYQGGSNPEQTNPPLASNVAKHFRRFPGGLQKEIVNK